MGAGDAVYYPLCGDWWCDDFDYDWELTDPVNDPARHAAVMAEKRLLDDRVPVQIQVDALQRERNARTSGRPLWSRTDNFRACQKDGPGI